MDNVITTPSIAAVNDSPPPPRLPPRAWRPADTDSEPPPPVPRHSPPPPPIPAREPLTTQTRLVVPRTVHHHGGHHGQVITAGPTQLSQQQPAVTGVLHPVSVDRLPPALDRVVPVSLSHWPFRTCTDNYVVKTLDNHNTHHHLHPVVQQTPRRVDAGAPTAPPLLPSVVLQSHTAGNEYVDAPTQLRRGHNNNVAAAPPSATAPSTARRTRSGVEPLPVPASTNNCLRVQTLPSVVVTQPTSPSTTKFHNVDDLGVAGTHGGGEKCGGARSSTEGACRGAVLCSRCGRCRCASCTAPRELPRHWFGDCECSVQRCVGVTSCVCCVEALFYHFLDGGGAADGGCDAAADDPCACCERPRCCVRWTLMGALAATVLPCLWCYCPLQCAADAVTSCYNGCTASRGCRCGSGVAGAQEASSSGASTRGLLAESESSST